ncbi:MAG: class II aldolase/adducin family protein [Chloroflexi bacterium]|nr:class II aldolase/adducin family protein [Chloroflexota bacterium]
MASEWSDDERRLIQELIRVGQLLFKRDLTWGTAGNLSARVDANHCVITGAGTVLEDLRESDFARAAIDGDDFDGPTRPSSELKVHQQVYLACPDAGAVLHASPFFTTLAASSNLAINTALTPEAMVYVGEIHRVPYMHAGSAALAEAVGRAAPDANVVIMENHGMVAIGPTVKRAFTTLETLEVHCKYEIWARAAGLNLNYIAPALAAEYAAQSAYKLRQ